MFEPSIIFTIAIFLIVIPVHSSFIGSFLLLYMIFDILSDVFNHPKPCLFSDDPPPSYSEIMNE